MKDSKQLYDKAKRKQTPETWGGLSEDQKGY